MTYRPCRLYGSRPAAAWALTRITQIRKLSSLPGRFRSTTGNRWMIWSRSWSYPMCAAVCVYFPRWVYYTLEVPVSQNFVPLVIPPGYIRWIPPGTSRDFRIRRSISRYHTSLGRFPKLDSSTTKEGANRKPERYAFGKVSLGEMIPTPSLSGTGGTITTVEMSSTENRPREVWYIYRRRVPYTPYLELNTPLRMPCF